MCEPVSIAMAVGALLTVAGGAMQADAQMKAGAYQAQVANNQAKMVEWRAEAEEDNTRQKTAQMISAQRAKYAAAGIDPNIGTPVDVQASSAIMGELDALTIRTNAQNEAAGLRSQGQAAKALGKAQAWSTALSTAGQVASSWASSGMTAGGGGGLASTGKSGLGAGVSAGFGG